MAREGLSEIRGILQSLLDFQAKNALNRDDLLLFLGLLNVTMAMNLLQKRMDSGGEVHTSPAAGGNAEPLAALGQLLAGRGKGTEGAGAAAPLAGLLGRDANLPALVSTVAGLLKQQGGAPSGGGGEPAPEPARPGESAGEAPTGEEKERPAERPAPRPAARREPLRWDFGRK
ncbi:MAG: hypothetical protein QME76_08650 [Bacillota bacterium]|nr:hypothetical protein [Bacillota bacterium]